ncbi:MAG TPA: peptidoglycan-binding domain-containing protein [Gaiellaceae bacterium]|jgi:hypothetical protein
MNDREPPGYDDWFDEPEPPTLETGRGSRQPYDAPSETEEDVWTLPEDEPRRSRRPNRGGSYSVGGRTLTGTQIAILAIAALAIFIAILAAAGVFSSTPAPTTQTITTQNSVSTPTTATTATVTVPSAAALPIQEPDHGPQVKILQHALIQLGYLQPPADGVFGPGTKSAVQSFQSAYGLTADGVVGTDTVKKLKEQLQQLGG